MLKSKNIYRIVDSSNVRWTAFALLYEGLMRFAPSLGGAVARAVAIGRSRSTREGLAALDRIESKAIESFQPAWVARAHLCELDRSFDRAVGALDQAISLTKEPRSREHLQKQRLRCVSSMV